ncbi:MAG TPA: ABA4-like family protein [Vicinamibacteria bacterium]|nr:ABA4-like family protein [Vicinamibacteria bacterium]
MSMENLFDASFVLVAPFWLLMIFAPHWPVTRRIVQTVWIVAPAALLYAILILPRFVEVFPLVLMPEHAAIRELLGSPAGTTIGWIHYLAFDLFVGRWVYLDSRERGFSAWLVSPILFLVLMLGPFGFVLYLALRYTAPMIRAESA